MIAEEFNFEILKAMHTRIRLNPTRENVAEATKALLEFAIYELEAKLKETTND